MLEDTRSEIVEVNSWHKLVSRGHLFLEATREGDNPSCLFIMGNSAHIQIELSYSKFNFYIKYEISYSN